MTAVLQPAIETRRPARRLLPLALIFLAVGTSTAMVGPFLTLFLTGAVHAASLQVTAFLIAAPLSSVIVSTILGRLSDRYPIRRYLIIAAALAGTTGALSTSVVRNYWALLALTVTATAAAGSLVPQLFAYARTTLAGSDRAAMTMSSLRTVFSLSWVAGPFVATVLLGLGGFRLSYSVSATMYLIAAVIAWRLLPAAPSPVHVPPEPASESVSGESGPVPYIPEPEPSGPASGLSAPIPDAPRRVIFLTVAAFALMQCASGLGVQAMSLFVTTDLGGGIGSAGVILGVCAGLEIPLMLGFGYLSTRVPLRRLVLAGPLFSVAYTLSVAASTHVWQVAAAQLFAACTVSVVQGLGVSYVQEMLPRHPGRASTLFTNAFPAGQMMAGPILGVAQHVGYRAAYLSAAGLALIAFAVLKLARTRRRSA
jgi:SET family sugar efflux transporter-like MFS transporter